MARLINQLGVSEHFRIKTIVQVEELMNHDMIYVYHHLGEGTILQLERSGTNVKGDPRFMVRCKSFCIGFVTIGGLMKQLFENEDELTAQICGMNKRKFLPIEQLDVQVGLKALKKVS